MIKMVKIFRKMFDLKTAKHSSLFSQFDHIVTGCDSRIKQVDGTEDNDDNKNDDDDDNNDSGKAFSRDLHSCSFTF